MMFANGETQPMQAVLWRRVLIRRSYEQSSHCPDIGNMRWQVGQMGRDASAGAIRFAARRRTAAT